MNAILKGLVGASVLLGATALSASAQDYTWTLTNFEFQAVQGFPSTPLGTEHPDASASGTIVLTRVGPVANNDYVVKSFNITTTTGSAGGTAPTGYGVVYNSATGASSSTNVVSPLETFLSLEDENFEYILRLQWDPDALFGGMEFDNAGEVVTLSAGNSIEHPSILGTGTPMRYSGTGFCVSPPNDQCSNGPTGGYLVLALGDTTQQEPPIRTPEPASMALFGAGLLGLFAARRRRAA